MIKKGISIVLPVYNEGEVIESVIKEIHNFLAKNFTNFEIIAVNDGSTDDSLRLLQKLKSKRLISKVINHKKNLGYGATLRDGFLQATKDYVFYTDSDNQFNIADLKKILPLINKYDIVSAYRLKRADPFPRIVTASLYNILLKTLFDIKVRDIDASFKLYKKKIFQTMTLKSQTGLIDAEILIKAKKNGFSIGQIGVGHYPRKNGKTIYETPGFSLVKPSVVVNIMKEIKLLWPELR